MTFKISTDYSPVTGLRHCNISDCSGEDFYHNKLNKAFANAIENNDKLILILDGVKGGYSPSFIDEAIGNLVYDFGLSIVKKNLEVISEREKQWTVLITDRTYPSWETRRITSQEPTLTQNHPAWYRLTKNGLECKEWIKDINV